MRPNIFLKKMWKYFPTYAEGMTTVLPWFCKIERGGGVMVVLPIFSAILGGTTEMYFTFLKQLLFGIHLF